MLRNASPSPTALQLDTSYPPPSFSNIINMGDIDPSLSSEPADTNGAIQAPPNSQPMQPGQPMQTLQPSHPDQYRAVLPPPHTMYPPPYQGQPQMPYAPAQPAPRQRTAIACRYCRRRKVCDTIATRGYRVQLTRDVRSVVQASTNPRMDAAPTASASPRNASSLPSRPRPKRSFLRTPFGAARTHHQIRSSTVHTANHSRNTAVAIRTHSKDSNKQASIHRRRRAISNSPCTDSLRRSRVLRKVVLDRSAPPTSRTRQHSLLQIQAHRLRCRSVGLPMGSNLVTQTQQV